MAAETPSDALVVTTLRRYDVDTLARIDADDDSQETRKARTTFATREELVEEQEYSITQHKLSDLARGLRRCGHDARSQKDAKRLEISRHAPWRPGAEVSGVVRFTIPNDYVAKKPGGKEKWAKYMVAVDSGGESATCLAVVDGSSKKNGTALALRASDRALVQQRFRGAAVVVRPVGQATMEDKTLRATRALLNAEINVELLRAVLDPTTVALPTRADLAKVPSCGGDFNDEQKEAMALEAAVERGIVCVQGPPGTGKSHLALYGVIAQAVARGDRVLVCCNANKAVDQLIDKLDKLTRSDMKTTAVARVGHQPSLSSEAQTFFVEQPCEAHRVVFSTLYHVGKQEQPWAAFDVVVVDEAAAVSEDRTLVVLGAARGVKKLVLVGDQNQLQPYVSDSLRRRGFGISLMERFIAANAGREGVSHVMLREQHRMPPTLSALCSDLFYGGRLRDAPSVLEARKSLLASPLVVVDLGFGSMEFDPVERSFHNDAEADAVKRVYDGLRRRMSMDKIRVVTPFRAQTDELKTRITGKDKDELRGSAGSQTLGREGRSDKLEQEDTIDTIDKFQGSEAPVVVLSPVAPHGGNLHRAQDPHLINVGISRSKDALVVVGRATALAQANGQWRTILERAHAKGVVRSFASLDALTDAAVDELLGPRPTPPVPATPTKRPAGAVETPPTAEKRAKAPKQPDFDQ